MWYNNYKKSEKRTKQNKKTLQVRFFISDSSFMLQSCKLAPSCINLTSEQNTISLITARLQDLLMLLWLRCNWDKGCCSYYITLLGFFCQHSAKLLVLTGLLYFNTLGIIDSLASAAANKPEGTQGIIHIVKGYFVLISSCVSPFTGP